MAAFQAGLQEVAEGVYAYMQPDGSWGWSNAGIVAGREHSLLVDTLFDRALTENMLAQMRRAIPSAARISTVINTHANGDHCWGNQLVADARIVSSRRAAHEMAELPPSRIAMLTRAAGAASLVGPLVAVGGRVMGMVGLKRLEMMAEAAPFVNRIFRPFSFGDVKLRLPDTVFDGSLALDADGREVQAIEVGPAHTTGDVIAWIPSARVVFTGDILFIHSHPVVWEGPFSNWINAIDRILALDAAVVVPGHGPLADRASITALRDYLVHVHAEARKRFDSGMDAETAAKDISLAQFRHWLDAERIAVNVETAYAEFQPGRRKPDVVEMFARMARVARAVR